MKIWQIILLAASFEFFISENSAVAYDVEGVKEEVGTELIYCSVYFITAAALAGNSGPEQAKGVEPLHKLAQTALNGALTIFPEKVVQAKAELAQKTMTETLQEEGFSRLILQYNDVCATAMKHPEQRVEYWKQRYP